VCLLCLLCVGFSIGGVACGGAPPVDTTRPAKGGTLEFRSAFSPDPMRVSGSARGTSDASTLGETDTGPCAGWVSENPDYYFHLFDRFDYLRVEVASDSDTSLVIEGPDGRFCSDDRQQGDQNPKVDGFFREGDYAVRVGTKAEGQTAEFQLFVSQNE